MAFGKVRPVKPSEIVKRRKSGIPKEVFEVFNSLLEEKFDGHSAVVYQDKVVSALVEKGLDRSEIFERGWLDIEGHYRRAGWKVEYDKPGYSESYEAHFIFSLSRGVMGVVEDLLNA